MVTRPKDQEPLVQSSRRNIRKNIKGTGKRLNFTVVHYSAETTDEQTVVQQAFELVGILRFVM